MDDFVVFNVSWMLNLKVTTYDAAGNIVPDDGEYQREAAERQFIFAEFIASRGLLVEGTRVSRAPDFELKASQFTADGLAFTRQYLDKWDSLKTRPPNPAILEKYWKKFQQA